LAGATPNGVTGITQRLHDWSEWHDAERYDWIIGSDILYGESMHPHLRAIFEGNLAPGGRVLLSDPFRATSFRLLEAMEADGWTIGLTKWTIGEEGTPRPIGIFELQPPEQGRSGDASVGRSRGATSSLRRDGSD
jgi:methyltransferase-like protein 23